jgi:rhamnose utilization protein RhaD (predicted bifunctional aldolase and dehydrogenase)
MSKIPESELASLRAFSACLGRNPLLVQASAGNTSTKIDGTLWIKSSGKWLRTAELEDIFVAVPIVDVKLALDRNTDVISTYRTASGERLRSSIETSMHAVLPHRVIAHLHSVNTIAWAVREDGRMQLSLHLRGLNWEWIRYVPSGCPLAREIEQGLSRSPDTNIFVLENHGLVICGDSCSEVQQLLFEVERRLWLPARLSPEPDEEALHGIVNRSYWRLPTSRVIHALATDRHARKVLSRGVLYPCQSIFLGDTAPVFSPLSDISNQSRTLLRETERPFIIIDGIGVLLAEWITEAEREILIGLAEVVQRINPDAPIRYLTARERVQVSNRDAYHYVQLASAPAQNYVSEHAN